VQNPCDLACNMSFWLFHYSESLSKSCCLQKGSWVSYYLPCFCGNSASESLDFKPPMLVSNSEVSSHTLKECCEQQFGTPSGAKIKLCRWGGGQSIPEPGKDGKDVQKLEIPSIYWLVVSTCQRGSICLYYIFLLSILSGRMIQLTSFSRMGRNQQPPATTIITICVWVFARLDGVFREHDS